MKRKGMALLCALLLCLLPLTAVARGQRLLDEADLLTTSEEQQLLSQLDEISDRLQVDLVVVTVDGTGGYTVQDYAERRFESGGYGLGTAQDGVLLLISMEERDWHIATHGYGITALTAAGIQRVGKRMVRYLSDGDYAGGFEAFAKECDRLITRAKNGNVYDVVNGSDSSDDDTGETAADFAVSTLWVSLLIGAVIALISVMVMKGKLRSVRPQTMANSYIRQGGLQLTENSDLFLYQNVTRTERPRDTNSSSGGGGGSSTHSSSSGSTFGGGGGKF